MTDPMAHPVPMNMTGVSTRHQLGLDLGRAQRQARPPRRTCRPCSRERALWWFQQMRRAIGEPEPSPNGVGVACSSALVAG